MRSILVLQFSVLICLLFAATLCIRFHDPAVFSQLETPTPDMHAEWIEKLEAGPTFQNKANTIALVKALVKAESTTTNALQATAEVIETLGYFLLFLAFLQSLGIFYTLRSRRKSA